MTANEIVQHFKSLAWLWRHASTIAVMLGGLWMFSGPFVKSYAADAFTDMLIQNGLDPKDFAEMKDATEEQQKAIQKLQEEVKKFDQTLGGVNSTVNNVERLVQELVRAQLNRRSSVEDMPPWPGPVQP